MPKIESHKNSFKTRRTNTHYQHNNEYLKKTIQNLTISNFGKCVELFPQIVGTISTNQKCLHECRHKRLTFNLGMKAKDYLLFHIKEAAPKTAAFSLIPEANTLIFPL